MSIESDTRFWNRSASKYAKSRIADEAGYARTLARTRAFLHPDSRILELGCGTGTTALQLANAVGTYLATDISPAMIAIAEEKYAAVPIAGLSFSAVTAETLPTQAGSFDTVLGFNYLHLVHDVSGTLDRIHALLAHDGLLITKTPCLASMNALIRRLLLPAMQAFGRAPHVSSFSADGLRAMIAAAGFDIVAMENHASRGGENRPYIAARKR